MCNYVSKCGIYKGKSEMVKNGHKSFGLCELAVLNMCDQTEAAAHRCSSK